MKAILVIKDETGYRASVTDVDEARLPATDAGGEVLIAIEWSTINYKDGLAITGKSPVLRIFPGVPGVDFAGTVEQSSDPRWTRGDRVILNGWGVGESHWGGLAQKARVRGDWLVSLPKKLTTRQAMAIGTAGYTAMMSILALEAHGVRPDSGEILVTGASGGLGGIAIILLARLGFKVVASTGRLKEADYLKGLGATEIIDRAELSAPGKPLARERWAGVIDSVGSTTLANACAATRDRGAVIVCGLAGGIDFPGTVAPFILRGITMYGIESVRAPLALREEAWKRLAQDLDLTKLDAITTEVPLASAIDAGHKIVDGQVRGRIVVNVNS